MKDVTTEPRTGARYREHFRQAEIAAEWLLRLETEGPGCQAAFAAWLTQSPLHVREFLALSGLSTKLRDIDPRRSIDVEGLIAAARGNVVPLQEQISRRTLPAARARWRRPGRLAAALAVLAALGWYLAGAPAGNTTYTTATGEQHTVKLSDGSIVSLNTRSRIAVDFDDGHRDIRLLTGEALFFVAPDAARPFRVFTGDAQIQALGTRFNVRRKSDGTVVAVVEGSVNVSTTTNRNKHPAAARVLTAGEAVRIGADGNIDSQAMADAGEAIAWRQRRLMFRERPLSEVAAEFNRYNTLQVRIEGEDLRRKLMTGAFDADNPRGLIRFLAKDGALSVTEEGDTAVIRVR